MALRDWPAPPSQEALSRPIATSPGRFAAPPLPGRQRHTVPDPLHPRCFDELKPQLRVPLPPPKSRVGFVRPARVQDRLVLSSTRGPSARKGLYEAFGGCVAAPAQPHRWGALKVQFTNLLDATSCCSTEKLLIALTEVHAVGGSSWPEFEVAQDRLRALQSLKEELTAIAQLTSVEDIRQVLLKAEAMGARPDLQKAEEGEAWPHVELVAPKVLPYCEFRPLCAAAERQRHRLLALSKELIEGSQTADMTRLSSALQRASDLEISGSFLGCWQEVATAD
ncbi:unnamed protein product, partial [Polarella glacialis]